MYISLLISNLGLILDYWAATQRCGDQKDTKNKTMQVAAAKHKYILND